MFGLVSTHSSFCIILITLKCFIVGDWSTSETVSYWCYTFINYLLNLIISSTQAVSLFLRFGFGTFSTMLQCYVPSMSKCHCFLLRYQATANKVWHCNTIHLIVPLGSLWKRFFFKYINASFHTSKRAFFVFSVDQCFGAFFVYMPKREKGI